MADNVIVFRCSSVIAVVIAVVMGIDCSIFLYRNSFGANQRAALARTSFTITQVSHCAVHRVQQSANVLQQWFDTMHVVCTDLLCVVSSGLLSVEFSTVNTGLGRPIFLKPLCLLSTP